MSDEHSSEAGYERTVIDEFNEQLIHRKREGLSWGPVQLFDALRVHRAPTHPDTGGDGVTFVQVVRRAALSESHALRAWARAGRRPPTCRPLDLWDVWCHERRGR